MPKYYVEIDIDDSGLNLGQKENINKQWKDFVEDTETAGGTIGVGEIGIVPETDGKRVIGIDSKSDRKKIFDDV